MVSRQSNLIVESKKQVTDQKLREMLIAEIKRQNKPYGLYFEQVTGGYTLTQRRGLQAFTVIPLIVYRVYPDGRPDELVAGRWISWERRLRELRENSGNVRISWKCSTDTLRRRRIGERSGVWPVVPRHCWCRRSRFRRRITR